MAALLRSIPSLGIADVAELGTILSIWAHPDDETYLAAGVMAAARDAGQHVVCASASAGEAGTSDPARWPPDRLGSTRRWEAAAAMAILGVGSHRIHGLPDGSLAEHDAEGRAWVGALLEEVQPGTILTFGADGVTFHPDHLAVHRWVTGVWDERGRPCRLLQTAHTAERLIRFRRQYEEWGMYMSDQRPVGVPEADLALHVRLDGAGLDRKLAALRAMATQTAEITALLGPDAYAALVDQECFIDAV